MRNGETSAADRRGKVPLIAGAAGLIAVLGAGAWAVTDNDDRAPARHEAAPAVSAQPSDEVPGAEEEVRSLMEAGNVPRDVAEKWAAARAAADDPGSTIRRPLAAAGETTVSDADVRVRTVSKIRVTSARQDLSGQRELAWVADEGEPVGEARCSQTFQLSRDVPAEVRPSLLVCWRVSEARSVYTVMIDRKRPPSKERSVAQIDRAWAKLG